MTKVINQFKRKFQSGGLMPATIIPVRGVQKAIKYMSKLYPKLSNYGYADEINKGIERAYKLPKGAERDELIRSLEFDLRRPFEYSGVKSAYDFSPEGNHDFLLWMNRTPEKQLDAWIDPYLQTTVEQPIEEVTTEVVTPLLLQEKKPAVKLRFKNEPEKNMPQSIKERTDQADVVQHKMDGRRGAYGGRPSYHFSVEGIFERIRKGGLGATAQLNKQEERQFRNLIRRQSKNNKQAQIDLRDFKKKIVEDREAKGFKFY